MDVYKDFIKMIIILYKFNGKELPVGFLIRNYWHGVACGVCTQSDPATPWTVAHQAPLSMGFPRQEYWGGLHFLLQGVFPTQGWNPRILHWQVDSLLLSHLGRPMVRYTGIDFYWKFLIIRYIYFLSYNFSHNNISHLCKQQMFTECIFVPSTALKQFNKRNHISALRRLRL